MEMLTTMITPYRPDGSVDIETALKYVDWYYESGLDGIFAVCQSSEIFFLSLEERVALNLAVITTLLPNTGISLPFFSYGGSSLVMLLAQMGVVLAVSRQSRMQKEESPE